MLLEGGVVDQDVEPAEPFTGASTAAADAIGHVAGDQMQRRPSFPTARSVSSASSCSLETDDRDVSSFTREQHRHGAPDAGIAAGDQRDLVEQLVRAL